MLRCKIFGHKWKYKDYRYSLNTNGNSYKFSASRICSRCEKKEYRFSKWMDEKFKQKEEMEG